MTIHYEARLSDSPYIESVTRGWTEGDGSVIRPAESHWHLVLVRYQGKMQLIVAGALTTSGVVLYTDGAEVLWIQLKLGTFLPALPARTLLDKETPLPGAACQTFRLNGSTWQFPTYDNVETFINRLAHAGALTSDPIVSAALQDGPQDMIASRTLRHHFLGATGMSQNHIYQIERAQQAAALLAQGASILDTMYQVGYFDQPHLTRALKQWVGHTPAEIIRMSTSA